MNYEITVKPMSYEERRGRSKRTIVYFGHKGESIMENLIARRFRPRDLYATYLPEVAEKLGLARTAKFRWSQKAGCSCGCSPGFVCAESYNQNVWVELIDAPTIAEGTHEQVQVRLAEVAALAETQAMPNLIEQ